MDRDAREAYLEAVLVGGRERVPIRVVDYDPAWPARFEAERQRITAALGPAARTVEHIGSTAVPGLPAKPIIDVLVTVDDVEREDRYAPALESAGYLPRVREPGHRMFRTPQRDVHVHLYTTGDDEVGRVLLFRDRLRTDTADRALYARVKRDLATRDWRDMNDYAEAKTPTINAILARARTP